MNYRTMQDTLAAGLVQRWQGTFRFDLARRAWLAWNGSEWIRANNKALSEDARWFLRDKADGFARTDSKAARLANRIRGFSHKAIIKLAQPQLGVGETSNALLDRNRTSQTSLVTTDKK
jgi:hypothetical protein